DVTWLDKQRVYVSWMEGATIMGAQVSKNGNIVRNVLAESSTARDSGFPQIEFASGQLILAWTDSESKTVMTKMIKLERDD
ncbi:MAG: exo-alpha-sialidase, partial [Fulvivirga sp.]